MYPSQQSPTTPRPRQQAGLACDECRRRKLRCDREQPQCGLCRDSGVVCNRTTTKQPRGPKKGHLRALQLRIMALERRLGDQTLGDQTLGEHTEDDLQALQDTNMPYPSSIEPPTNEWLALDVFNEVQESSANSSSDSSAIEYFPIPAPLIENPTMGQISDVIKHDLDHLYFDRAHNFCPILNKRHYFDRARQTSMDNNVTAFSGLRYTMWTVAASTSSQFQHVQDELYANARRILDSLEMDPSMDDYIRVEHLQACTLLFIYELMHVNYRQGWMSAGKLFRSAILQKLHTVDGRDELSVNSSLTATEIEERRRTFWMLFVIDCFVSLMDQLPLTFNQHIILTRLPMPEANFQNNDPIVMPLPSQARPDDEPQAPSSFTESIRQAILCNQSLSHYQRSIVEQEAQGASSLDFWTRHQRLETSIAMNLERLSLQDHCANLHLDSLPLLTHMTTQAAIITMYKTMQTSLTQSEINTHQDAIGKLTHMVLPAAQRMTALSKELSELSFFQVHPFIPILLYHCIDFLCSHSYLDPVFELQTALYSALRGLENMSKIANDCLVRLEMTFPSVLSKLGNLHFLIV
ncbi:hypothetical protein COCMIDRAFT_97965 [Bipolaris oryzae ATCC 44560]|uniref:Zn(2)-C6 fungal-type domain-containing protein n=1 Tax=Bipolaris oryzae ATCC 44560 TaxID=930090 RepID=W6ZAK1_COCMI|nr:uncharacterized protein COCMIDRAFT_97965 [Bipolaris oryzae ATCC 44560]EUC44549.1 hypothetical protein COCMIDRAFT_97965 [Bipolaris oryzae ATCC 44560]